ncbi:VOC family protein [Microbulbifer sp. ALW1]|uniref:VOC family protein n=1 Tax=Microbulbifer sp. (strain ALW1) TaxID=1516059 RepID=UPI001357B442|nr:VOC family protein [Microbulbifer sp. ALW1]
MAGPARNGALVYSDNFQELSMFYREFFGMKVLREAEEFVSLDNDGFNVVIHAAPFKLPEDGFNAVKLFLTVNSLDVAKRKAAELGGQVFEGEWENSIFKVCNIADPDGNQIQIREFL